MNERGNPADQARERRIRVTRSARYFTIGNNRTPEQLWIVCHGFAQLAVRFLSRFRHVASERILVAAPEALNRFYLDTSPRPHGPDDRIGATWMTREDRASEIHDYVAFLDAVHDECVRDLASPPRLVALGFSQGAVTVARWVALGAARPEHSILWAAPPPADPPLHDVAERWRATRTTLVWGRQDAPAVAVHMRQAATRLEEVGAAVACVEFDGGHEIHADTLRALAKE